MGFEEEDEMAVEEAVAMAAPYDPNVRYVTSACHLRKKSRPSDCLKPFTKVIEEYMKKQMMTKYLSKQQLVEQALSVVMAKWGKEAIAERNALQSEVEALREELSQLRDGMLNQCPPSTLRPDPENADFIVASYFGERHFRIPQDADRTRTMLVKWGQLHYWSKDEDRAAEDPIYDNITDEFDKRPLSEYWIRREEYIEYAGPEPDGDDD